MVVYKTDVVDEALGLAGASKKHEAQASAYLEAVRLITGVPAEVVFVIARPAARRRPLGA